MLTKIINSSLDFLGVEKTLPIPVIQSKLNTMYSAMTNLDGTVRDSSKEELVMLIVWTFQSLENLKELQNTEKEALFILHLLTNGNSEN